MNLIIRNGVVIDGTGNPWIKADVGVEGDRIVRVGDLSGVKADQEIDAKGMTVTPGFVDTHCSSEWSIVADPEIENKLTQGMTADISGLCGFSSAPLGKKPMAEWWNDDWNLRNQIISWEEANEIYKRHRIDVDWKTFDEYFTKLEKRGISINYCSFCGHFALRAAVTGEITQSRVSDSELEEMKKLLAQAMKDGAMGFSTERGSHTKAPKDEGEVLELAKEAGKYGGIFVSDMRGYRYDSKGELEELHTVTEAIIEEIETVEAAGVRASISHINASAKGWEDLSYALRQIEEARARGVDIVFDQMMAPGTRSMTQSLDDYLPEWAREGGDKAIISRLKDPETRKKVKEEMVKGGIDNWRYTPETYPLKANWWHNVQLEWCPANRELEGKTFAQLSKMRGTDPIDVILDLIVETDNTTRFASHRRSISEEQNIKIMTHPLAMFGTDGVAAKGLQRTYWGVEREHYNPFPDLLERYVKEKKVMPLQEAIRKLTSAPCQFYGFEDRGLIRKGMYADIVVFDPARVHSNVTAMEIPERLVEGIDYVLVNGVVVIDGGMHTGARPGKVLRRARAPNSMSTESMI